MTSSAIYSVNWCGIVRLLRMPRPSLPVDWDAIRSLYLNGVDPRALAQRFAMSINTLRSRACREKWNVIRDGGKESKAQAIEKSTAIARDIWSERRETIRERIHLIGDRMTKAASELAEDQLLNKADKIKIATEIAGKSVGLDREEDRNQVNIAILGSIDSVPGSYYDSRSFDSVPQAVTILPSDTVRDTDTEAVSPTSHPTTVDSGTADPV